MADQQRVLNVSPVLAPQTRLTLQFLTPVVALTSGLLPLGEPLVLGGTSHVLGFPEMCSKFV